MVGVTMMGFDWLAPWVLVAAVVAVVLAAGTVHAFVWSPGRRRRVAVQFLAERGMGAGPGEVETVAGLLVVRRKGEFLGIALAGVGVVAAMALLPPSPPGMWVVAGMPVAALPVVCGALAVGLTGPEGGPRVARAMRPHLDDHLPRLLRWWPVIGLVAAVVVTVAFLLAPPADRFLGRGEALWALGSVGAVVALNEVVARWLVTRPRPAASPLELAVRDETVGEQLARLAFNPLPLVVTIFVAAQWGPAGAFLGLGLVAVAFPLEARRRRRVGDRLWRRRPAPPPSTSRSASNAPPPE